jgi:hypothetical protein
MGLSLCPRPINPLFERPKNFELKDLITNIRLEWIQNNSKKILNFLFHNHFYFKFHSKKE